MKINIFGDIPRFLSDYDEACVFDGRIDLTDRSVGSITISGRKDKHHRSRGVVITPENVSYYFYGHKVPKMFYHASESDIIEYMNAAIDVVNGVKEILDLNNIPFNNIPYLDVEHNYWNQPFKNGVNIKVPHPEHKRLSILATNKYDAHSTIQSSDDNTIKKRHLGKGKEIYSGGIFILVPWQRLRKEIRRIKELDEKNDPEELRPADVYKSIISKYI